MVYKILMTGMSPVLAGTETFIMNYYRHLDKSKFQVDFIKRTTETVVFEDEIKSNGSKIFYLPRKGKNPIAYKKAVREFFEEFGNDYDAIWYNAMGIPNIDLLQYAKKYGIRTRILHSHSSMWKGSAIKYILHRWNQTRLKTKVNKYFACSGVAADYMFLGNLRPQVQIIQNAIEMEKFSFSESKRTDLRMELGWNDCKVIGNVGRLDVQKNQPFLIDIFYEAYKKDNTLRLVIIGKRAGTNSTEDLIKEKIQEYNLQDKVLLAGSQFDMQKWLSAMDLFILPSIFEGLPLSAVEAQANGLPVLVSDAITKELKILNQVQYLSLNDDKKVWRDSILEMIHLSRTSQVEIEQKFTEKGFDIVTQAKDIEKLFLGE